MHQLLAIVNGLDLAREEARGLRLRVALLRLQRVLVLGAARHILLHAHVLRGLAEGDRVVAEVRHARVGQAPSERGVHERPFAARERLRRLERDERRAGHALHAARDHQVGFAGADAPRRVVHRFESAAAQPVHRHAGDRLGQARKERRHSSDVAIVFTGLVRGAEHDLVDLAVSDVGPLEDRADHMRSQVIRADRGERSAVATEGRAHVADDHRVASIGIGHRPSNSARRFAVNAFTPSA